MIIVLSKNKLIGLDAVIPLLFELKPDNPHITVVLRNEEQRAMVHQNYHIQQALDELGAEMVVLRKRPWQFIKFLIKLIGQRNLILKDVDSLPKHKITIWIIKLISRSLVKQKTFLGTSSTEFHKSVGIEKRIIAQRKGEPYNPDFFKGDYDEFLCGITKDDFRECYGVNPPDKFKYVGYTRGLKGWTEFVNRAAEKVEHRNYFLCILGFNGKRSQYLDEPEKIELLKESLLVLKKFKIKTVFKPHPLTDMDQVGELLKEINYQDYVIDYGHPMILSKRANFVFGNWFSVTFLDAHYLGVPVIEYSQYDQEVFEKFGGSRTKFVIYIHRDSNKLEEAVRKTLQGISLVDGKGVGRVLEEA